MIINNTLTVNSALSTIPERVLYHSPIFIPGITFSNDYQTSGAGEILVSKFKGSGATDPQPLGNDFNGSDYANDLIRIPLVNSFQKEYKIRGVAANAVPMNIQADAIINITEEQRTGWEKSGLGVLVDTGTVRSETTALSSENVKDILVDARKELVKNACTPDVCLCSPTTYAEILKQAGKEFVPVTNEKIVSTARVGSWMGFVVVEAGLLEATDTLKYIADDGKTVKEVKTAGVDFIMYDHKAFSILELLVALRVVDAENFVGSKVQGEIDCGYKVTNEKCVYVRKHSSTPSG